MLSLQAFASLAVFSPLLGALLAGLLGKSLGVRGAHSVTIALIAVSLLASLALVPSIVIQQQSALITLYTWAQSGSFNFTIGYLLDSLTVVMMVIVTFVSLLVHIYSVGYMQDDPGYQRFFSYMSLFTFAMLMLVTASNFLQVFFGWEGVGLVSYLLIGFWFDRESAAVGSMKAFIVNRVGDFGFLLGIAAILDYFGSLDYAVVFAKAPLMADVTTSLIPGSHWSVITVICVLLFIGAMGKSAQVPLHVWLPESMEGPTPISALIHAATMVTAGVFLVARMSPLFQLSVPASSLVLIVGATGALFLGLLAFVENDIKRIIAFSTMSQLGYMMAANGASAYSASIFHLMTHACFKALLFLAAGSVIIGLHHQQDIRYMGNLRKYLPVTYITFLIGALALAAIPPLAGFYSKDAIIEAVHLSTIPGAHYAYWCLLIGSFVTSYYIFRCFLLVFHGEQRFSVDPAHPPKEYWIMLVPLIALAVPSVMLGAWLFQAFLFKAPGVLANSITVLPQYDVLAKLALMHPVGDYWQSLVSVTLHAFSSIVFWMAFAGIASAWLFNIVMPGVPAILQKRLQFFYWVLREKYGFDHFNEWVFQRGVRRLSRVFYYYGDMKIIDHLMVDGSGRGVERASKWLRYLQSGYLYHYVLAMIIGLIVFLAWVI